MDRYNHLDSFIKIQAAKIHDLEAKKKELAKELAACKKELKKYKGLIDG